VVEQTPYEARSIHPGADDCPPPDTLLADEGGPLEERDVHLHRRELIWYWLSRSTTPACPMIAWRTMSRRVGSVSAPKTRSWSTTICIDTTVRL
jgi:hypothetical protein